MKILILCSKNSGRIAPFITEQVEALQKAEVVCEYFTVVGKGASGYLKSRRAMMERIKQFQPDIIHAHYGLSGLLANLQRKVPVVTTYHGSDINNDKVLRLSKLAIKLSKHNIFVSQKNIDKAKVQKRYSLIPCGVDISTFFPQDKEECRDKMNLEKDKRYVLFAGAFDNQVKNPQLAKDVVAGLDNVKLLELKGYNRKEVACLMNAVDACLMTSHSEGSPQFVKEAMACNCPIVSVNVGDVKETMKGVENCRVVDDYNVDEISENLVMILDSNERSDGRDRIMSLGISLDEIAEKIISIYKELQ